MPATPYNLVFNASLQVDPASIQRASTLIRGVGRGVGSNVTVNTSGAVAGLSKVSGSASSAQAALRAAQAQAASLNATLNVTATVTNTGASNLANLATQAGLAARRFLAFSVAAGTMVRAVQGLKEGVRAAVEFELSMNKVAQVSTDSRTQIAELRQTISGLATSLGVSSAALAETSVTLKQAGFTIKQTRDALEALALVDLAPTFDGQKQAAEGLIAAFRQFDLSSRDFKSSLSSINAVAAEFAVESADIVTAIQKAGGAFKVSAGDMKSGSQALNEFVALFTSVRDTTRESADSIATGLRTVFTRLQRQDTVAALKDLGINLRYTREEAGKLGQSNLENQFVGAYEAVRRLSEGLAGLRTTDPRYSQVVEQLGGYRQISRVIPLLQQFETAQKALNIAQSGQLSLQAAAEKRQETLAAKTAKLKEEYLDLFRKIVDSKGFQGVANGVLVAAGAFKTFLDAARPLLPLLTALAAIKIGSSIGGIVGNFARSFVAAPGTATVKKFASGGFVPGSGNNDTEPALLMPGEFVLNKQAVAKMGVPALRDLNQGNSRFHLKRYADGSTEPVGGGAPGAQGVASAAQSAASSLKAAAEAFKVTQEKVQQIIAEFSAQVGADLSKLIKGVVVNEAGVEDYIRPTVERQQVARGRVDAAGNAILPNGSFNKNTGVIGVSSARVTSESELRRVVAHELGHAADVQLGGGQYASKESGTSASAVSGTYEASGAPGRPKGSGSEAYLKYRQQPHEQFADAVAAKLTGVADNPQVSELLARAAGKPAVAAPVLMTPPNVAGAPTPGVAVAAAGKSRLDRLRSQQKGTVDQTQVNAATMTNEDPFLKEAASRRAETTASVNDATSAAEQARVKAAQQAEAATQLTAGKSGVRSAIESIPPEQRERFFQLNEKAVNSANKYAETQRGRAGESASNGGDLDDFVTEHFAKNAFPKIQEAEANPQEGRRVNPAAYSNRAGVIAAQAYFTKQGKYTAAGVLDESQDVAGREVAPQDAVTSLAGSADPETDEAKRNRTRAKQLAQVKEALGGKLPTTHQETVDAAKALGVSAKVAHTASGAGTDSAGNITNVLAAAVKEKVGAVTTADDIAALKAGGVATNNPTALREGRPAALGGAGRPPRKPPQAPPTGGAPDPFEDYRKKYPEEAAYQDAALAKNDEDRSRRELAKGDRFAREAARTQRTQDDQTRAARQGYAAAPGVDGRPVGDRFPPGSSRREQETYQLRQLAEAKGQYGPNFGVPEDELAERSRRTRAKTIGEKQAAEYESGRRAESGAFVDPLVVAKQTRRDRYDAAENAKVRADAVGQSLASQQSQEQLAVGQGMNAAGSGRGGFTAVGDRIVARQARGAAGVTDPLAIKAAALAGIRNGEDPDGFLGAARDQLSPAQQRQLGVTGRNAGSFGGREVGPRTNAGSAVDLFGQVGVTDPYTGEQQVGPDGKPVTRDYGLIAQRAKALSDQRITERGGADNLSGSTKAAVEAQALAEQELAVKRELISAQENLLKVLQPQMSAMERQTKAIEDTEKALGGQAKVVRDQKGKILGTEDAVNKATAKGIQAPGAGGFTYGLQQRFGGALDSAREFARNNAATRLNARLAGFTNSPSFGYTAAGLGAAGAYAANHFDQRAGKVEDAIATESGTSTYKTNKSASGAISFGLAGAAAGFAAGGPVGAAIGAVAGAGYGLYSALQDAEKDIREAKIGNALTELGTKLSAFATGLPDFATTSGIGGQLDIYDREANQRAFDKANGFFGFDAGEYAEFRSKDVRKELGPLLPQIGQGLNAQATRVGRDNPNARNLDELTSDLLGRGSNRRLLGTVAQLRGTTERDEERNIREAIVKGQETERIARENRAGQNGVQSSVNSFDRLTKALQASADGLSSLQARAAALSDVFEGTISAARVSANSEALDQFGRGDSGALAPLDIVAAATGDLGGQLRASGGATNAVRGSLDRVLPTVIANRGIEAGDITTEVTRGLYRDLGYDDPQKAPQEIQRTVAAVAAQLNQAQDGGRGLGGILSEVQVDASKFNDTLVSAMSDPIKEFGQRAAKQLEDNANKFIDGLTTLAQRTQQVGQLYDQRASLRGNNFRTQFQVEQERAGRGNEGLGRATVEQLEQGFDARQGRLGGNVAFSPAGLGRELGSVRTQIEEAVGRQQSAFAGSGGNSPAFQQAAQEVVRLKDRAANLQQALKNLSDITERSAVIQEKLNRLKQEEDGRLGLGERFATASYEERARMNQGFVLANQAANRGTLDGFGADEQRQIVEALRSAGGVTLTGFNGSPRADDLLKNLLGNSFGGAFRLTGAQQQERAGLQGELGARGRTAEEAFGELIKHQEDANTKFLDNLRQQQTQFFSTLSALLLRTRLGDTENQIAGATARQRELQENGGRSKELLGRVGVTTSDQLVALRGRGQQLTALREAIQARAAAEGTVTSSRAALTSGRPEFKNVVNGRIDESAVSQFLVRNGINDPEALRRIQTRYNQIYNTTPYRGAVPPGAARDNEAARSALDRALGEEELPGGLVSSAYQRQGEARGGLAGIQGVNPLAVQQVLSGDPKDAEDFVRALNAFDTTNNRIETFGDRVTQVAAELDRLRGEAERLRTQISQPPAAPGAPGGAVTRANGGSIFESRGTDTVPAMLTPGEYVINAASARANAGLLHHINTARGPVQYRYDGGPILPGNQTPPKDGDRDDYTPDGLRAQYRQTGGPIIRTAEQNAPSASTVASGYLWAADKIRKGVSWLGFANGGRVPTYLAGGGPADNEYAPGTNVPTWFARKLAENERLKATANPTPISEAAYEARRNPTGRTAQARVEQAAAAATRARQAAAAARHERDREQYERDRLTLSGIENRRASGESSYSVVGGGQLSGAAQAGALTSAGNAEDALRRRVQRFYDRDAARIRRRSSSPNADAEEQRRAADTAAGNLAADAAQQTFNRASRIANSRTRRPGDEGQRNIALRNVGLQQGDISKRFETDPALQRYLALAGAGPQRFASGGPVHGAGVGDTVPSLLTNGEFVLSQNATARAGVHNLQRFNSGGPVGHVSYLASGGAVTSAAVGGELKLSAESERAMTNLGAAFNQFVQQVGGFTNAAQSLSQTFNVFAGHAQALTQALSAMPRQLTIQGTHQVNVVINGAEVLAKLTPELQQMVVGEVKAQLGRAFKEAMPDAGVAIN